jgi:group II intron reverse transcriptase/maturase
MKTTEDQIITETKLKRIKWLSSLDKHKEFNQLMHHFSEEALLVCYKELDRKKARGIDGVDKESYGANLEANLKTLVARLKTMSYIPGDILEVKIPKEGNQGTRKLGVSNFEDKLVQKMMHKVLESIYEPIFLPSSYGFRAGKGCHDAIRALSDHLYRNEVKCVIDIDLANFFGTIDREILMEILQQKIKDKKLLRYMQRMFKAGILSEGELVIQEEGVVQGSICSPILANIFAHYVIDEWIEEVVKQHCKGTVESFRYCDDQVICCQYEEDARKIRVALAKRLEKYKLTLNEEKTKMVKFSKEDSNRGIRQEGFDFLGLTFYLGKSRKGVIIPKVKSSGKRIRSKLKKVNDWCKAVRNKHKLPIIWKKFCTKLEGHIRYYGVSFNSSAVSNFLDKAVRIMFKWLNRRSQRKSFDWDRFELYIRKNPLPKVKIWHSLFKQKTA